MEGLALRFEKLSTRERGMKKKEEEWEKERGRGKETT
jgi:hypothetical protein